ncbi:unnamed protein product [Clonostachys rhizophaga]|uniref:Uncharacterized protein n=1 Tax=Clonostachys rhizophaga TaxID=160324 RepID=A0A9N9VRX3_9HYPO|nr:unnamed protein product [Clonostachys rhizophaga]
MSDEEPLDEKPLWEQFGFESLEELGRFHKYDMARRRATRPLPTDEEAENQQAEDLSKKAEKAAEPVAIQGPDSKKGAESENNEEIPKGMGAGDNTTSATNK